MAIEWVTKYGISRAKIGSIGYLQVAWSDRQSVTPGYEVSAFGVKLKINSRDYEAGKQRAIKVAKHMLKEAQEILAD